MNFLRRLFNRNARPELLLLQPPAQLPHVYDVRPGLKVHLVRRDPDWHYLTEGLMAFGQIELRMAIRWPEQGVPNDPFEFFSSIFDLASSGAVVDGNGRSLFGPNTAFGRTDLTGMLYVASNSSVRSQPESLLALPMLGAECLLRERGGTLRLLGLWGREASYFPFPDWFDPRRKPLAWAEAVNQASELEKLPGIPCYQVRAVQRDDSCVHLRINRRDQAAVQQSLSKLPERVLSFRTGLDLSADSLLAWLPWDPGPYAIGPPGSATRRICGCHFVCVQDGDSDFGGMREDGFSYVLTAESFGSLYDALKNGHNTDIECEYLSLKLRWLDSRPPTTSQFPEGAVQVGSVRLLQPEEVQMARLVEGAEELANFLSSLIATVQSFFQHAKGDSLPSTGFDLTLALKPNFQLRCWLDLPNCEYLLSQLEQLTPLEVSGGPLAFVIHFNVEGKPQPEWKMPRAWQVATQKAGRNLQVPDEILAAVWPDDPPGER